MMTKPNFYARENRPKQVKKNDGQPSEDQIHLAVIQWLEQIPYKGRRLADHFHHSPNGGTASIRQKSKFAKMGTRSGWPDLECPIARGKYHGLFVELKREKGGIVSANQKERLEMLNAEGYYAVVTRGYKASIEAIEKYMALEDGQSID